MFNCHSALRSASFAVIRKSPGSNPPPCHMIELRTFGSLKFNSTTSCKEPTGQPPIYNREIEHDVVNGRRQIAKITSDFAFFSSGP